LGWLGRLALIAGIIASTTLAINKYFDYRQARLIEKINASFGTIYDKDGSATVPEFEIGYGHAILKSRTGAPIIGYSGAVFSAHVKNKKLFVSAIIRGKDGKPIAVIDQNEWTMYNKDYEYNDNETAFELVIKGEHRACFQIELRDGRAHIQGILYDEYGGGFTLYSIPHQEGGYMHPFWPHEVFMIPEIAPIFKYPRERYYGVRVDTAQ